MNDKNIVSKVINTIDLVKNKKEEAKELLKYKNVPVVYKQTREIRRRKQNKPSLLSLINKAKSENEVNNFLIKGKSEYKKASTNTINKWEIASKQKICELKKKR